MHLWSTVCVKSVASVVSVYMRFMFNVSIEFFDACSLIFSVSFANLIALNRSSSQATLPHLFDTEVYH